MKNITQILQVFKKSQSFLISTHMSPDPDALCSELALEGYLSGLGKKVTVVNEDGAPKMFNFLPGSSKIKTYRESRRYNYDAAIIVDCGDLNRIGKVKNLIHSENILINIDHHLTNDFFGTLNLVRPMASSTCELVYDILSKSNNPFTKNVALQLYTGIMTDTGCFRYENTVSRTHEIASHLREFNFSAVDLYRKIYEAIPLNDIKEFTKAINGFEALLNGRVMSVVLRKKVVDKFSDDFDLRDAMFKFLRSIKGVEVIVIFTEISRLETRINLRSAGKYNVAELASHFNGGGHRNASGCMLKDNIHNTRKIVLKQIKKTI